MSIISVIVIPRDPALPVRRTSYDSSDYTNLTALIFDGDRTGTFDRMSVEFAGEEVTMWFDDNGLSRIPGEEVEDVVNLRAMELYATIAKVPTIHDFDVPLIGDFVITGGADEEGESLPAPEWIDKLEYTWHLRYDIRGEK